MKLAARMWLLGVVLPAAGTVAAVAVGGWVFRSDLEEDLDRALMMQASSERVSMFDGPYGPTRPHLHIDPRGLGLQQRVTVAATIYDEEGRPVAWYPGPAPAANDERVLPGNPDDPPVMHTREGLSGKRERVLRITAMREDDERYALELVASLTHVDAAVRSFYWTTLAVGFALTLLLVVVHTIHARQLASRVKALADHMKALRSGNLDAAAPRDLARDEIGELSAVVAEATQRLREARAAQERLIADAAHELRTPLTLVRTSVDVALRRQRSAADLEEILRVTRGEVDRVATLATRLLDVAVAGQGAWDRAPGDLVAVAREAVTAACASAEDRGVLLQLVAPEPVRASFHGTGIRQAIDNLLSNAVKYSPEGATIEVRVTPLPGGGGAVAVRDDGPGIPADERERVFEPFHRVAPEPGDQGAGLGLAIVREIAAKHGGRTYVEPTSGRGTTVVLEIPGDARRVRVAQGG